MCAVVLLRGRDFQHPEIVHALVDLAYNEEVNALMDRANDARVDFEEDPKERG